MPIIGDITKKPLIDTNANTKPRTRRNWQRAGATIGATAAGVTVSPTGGIIDGTAGLYINVDGTTTAINGSNQLVASGSSSGVTGVALAGSPVFSITGTPVTTAGTLTLNFVDGGTSDFLAVNGTGTATLRAITAADLPAGLGTVTSVGLTGSPVFSISGSPVTTAGNITLGFANGGTSDFLAVNATGTATLRAITAADLPAGVGSVTSVGLTGSPVFSISGSPITTAGTITLGFANGGTSDFLAVNATGTATLRAITTADLPATYPTVVYSGVNGSNLSTTSVYTDFSLRATLAAGQMNSVGRKLRVECDYAWRCGAGGNMTLYMAFGTIHQQMTNTVGPNEIYLNTTLNGNMAYRVWTTTAGTLGTLSVSGYNNWAWTMEPCYNGSVAPIDLTQSYVLNFGVLFSISSSVNELMPASFVVEQLA